MSFADNIDEVKSLTPMESDYVWHIEQFMLEIYLLLVHRVKGIGLSLNDFWEMDTWTLSMLYLAELDIIDAENKKSGNKDSYEKSIHNNPEMEDLFEEMFEDEMDN